MLYFFKNWPPFLFKKEKKRKREKGKGRKTRFLVTKNLYICCFKYSHKSRGCFFQISFQIIVIFSCICLAVFVDNLFVCGIDYYIQESQFLIEKGQQIYIFSFVFYFLSFCLFFCGFLMNEL